MGCLVGSDGFSYFSSGGTVHYLFTFWPFFFTPAAVAFTLQLAVLKLKDAYAAA